MECKRFGNWIYRGEGSHNLVIAHSQERIVYRLLKRKTYSHSAHYVNQQSSDAELRGRMEKNVLFICNVIRPLLGHYFTPDVDVVDLPLSLLDDIRKAVKYKYPGCEQVLPVALKIYDACFLPSESHPDDNAPAFCFEIKPNVLLKAKGSDVLKSSPAKQLYCRYCLLQRCKVSEGVWPTICQSCPMDLASGDEDRIKTALGKLFANPQNRLRVLQDGQIVYSKRNCDVAQLCEALSPYFSSENTGDEERNVLDNVYGILTHCLLHSPTPTLPKSAATTTTQNGTVKSHENENLPQNEDQQCLDAKHNGYQECHENAQVTQEEAQHICKEKKCDIERHKTTNRTEEDGLTLKENGLALKENELTVETNGISEASATSTTAFETLPNNSSDPPVPENQQAERISNHIGATHKSLQNGTNKDVGKLEVEKRSGHFYETPQSEQVCGCAKCTNNNEGKRSDGEKFVGSDGRIIKRDVIDRNEVACFQNGFSDRCMIEKTYSRTHLNTSDHHNGADSDIGRGDMAKNSSSVNNNDESASSKKKIAVDVICEEGGVDITCLGSSTQQAVPSVSHLPPGCVLDRIRRMQQFGQMEIEGAYPYYMRIQNHNVPWNNFLDEGWRKVASHQVSEEEDDGSVEFAAQKMKEFLVYLTMKSCSIMVTLQRTLHPEFYAPDTVFHHKDSGCYRFSIKVIDLDPKPAQKVPSCFELNQKYLELFERDYLRWQG